jgi:uncharacterized protein YyaL (SSP411 family)
MARAPVGFGRALNALELHLGPSREIAIVGRPDDPTTTALVRAATVERWIPNAVVAIGDPADVEAVERVPLLRDRGTVDGRAAAYVCEDFVCSLPVTTVDALTAQLEPASAAAGPT